MASPFLNRPSPEHVPTLLLYSFTEKELSKFRFLLKGFPGIRLMPVPESACQLPLKQLLEGGAPSGLSRHSFPRHMLVLAHIPDPLVHLLISICRQVTPEKVLKAMLTETNQSWSSELLYQNLLEEEAQLGG